MEESNSYVSKGFRLVAKCFGPETASITYPDTPRVYATKSELINSIQNNVIIQSFLKYTLNCFLLQSVSIQYVTYGYNGECTVLSTDGIGLDEILVR